MIGLRIVEGESSWPPGVQKEPLTPTHSLTALSSLYHVMCICEIKINKSLKWKGSTSISMFYMGFLGGLSENE